MLSVDQDTGIVRLMQYDPNTDPKFVEVIVDAIDNLKEEPFMMSSAVVKVEYTNFFCIRDLRLCLFLGILYRRRGLSCDRST